MVVPEDGFINKTMKTFKILFLASLMYVLVWAEGAVSRPLNRLLSEES